MYGRFHLLVESFIVLFYNGEAEEYNVLQVKRGYIGIRRKVVK